MTEVLFTSAFVKEQEDGEQKIYENVRILNARSIPILKNVDCKFSNCDFSISVLFSFFFSRFYALPVLFQFFKMLIANLPTAILVYQFLSTVFCFFYSAQKFSADKYIGLEAFLEV